MPKAPAVGAPPPVFLAHQGCLERGRLSAEERVVAATGLRMRTTGRIRSSTMAGWVCRGSGIPKALALAAPTPPMLRNNGHVQSPLNLNYRYIYSATFYL